MSDAMIGHGAALAMGDGGNPETFTNFAEVTRITPPGFTRGEEETTHLASPAGFKEFVGGLKEATACEIELNWIPSATDAVLAAFDADSANFRITAPNGVRIEFAGFLTAYNPGELAQGKLTATATIRPTGKPQMLAAL